MNYLSGIIRFSFEYLFVSRGSVDLHTMPVAVTEDFTLLMRTAAEASLTSPMTTDVRPPFLARTYTRTRAVRKECGQA